MKNKEIIEYMLGKVQYIFKRSSKGVSCRAVLENKYSSAHLPKETLIHCHFTLCDNEMFEEAEMLAKEICKKNAEEFFNKIYEKHGDIPNMSIPESPVLPTYLARQSWFGTIAPFSKSPFGFVV